MKSFTKLPLKLHVLLWVSILLMALFPVFWRAGIADFSLAGVILLVVWYGMVWNYRNRRLPKDKNEYVDDDDDDEANAYETPIGDPNSPGALSGGINRTSMFDKH